MTTTTDQVIDYNPLLLEPDPYPTYRRLPDEAPVYRGHCDAGEFWALSRFADVQAAARDWETFSSAEGNDLDDTGLLFGPGPSMDICAPPIHTRQRAALKREFRREVVETRLQPVARRKVRQLLDRLADTDQFDFAQEFGYPLPFGVICDWLGLPATDHEQLMRWHATMLSRTPGKAALPPGAMSAQREMFDYLREAVTWRRAKPQDDLLTVLAGALDGGVMSEDEVLANAFFLFDAGIVSTSALLSSALLHLHTFAEQRQLLWSHPELVPTAVEEMLRFDAPFQWFTRVTTREVELHGVPIPVGARVVLIWASANRDERHWTDPDELRVNRRPQRHLSFSDGIHHCLGNGLARMEARVLLEELIPALTDYHIVGPVERRITPSERTIVRLPLAVRWSPQRRRTDDGA